jgi:hypothetical protein
LQPQISQSLTKANQTAARSRVNRNEACSHAQSETSNPHRETPFVAGFNGTLVRIFHFHTTPFCSSVRVG